MPILAIPVATLAEREPDRTMWDTRTFTFRDLDGNSPFAVGTSDFFYQPDITGTDMPPREIVTRQIPGMEGERLSEIRIGSREVFLPLWIKSSASHLDYLDRRDQLARLFNHRSVDYRAQDGTLDLVANSARGERSLRCVYVDGMTNTMWPNEGAFWGKLGITLRAVRPYWTGVPWATPIVRIPEPSAWFGKFPPTMTSSRAFGNDLRVTVEGDAESWPTVDLVGPATAVTIVGKGLSVSVPGGLADGETGKIVTDPRGRVALFSGVRDWSRVAPTDRYQPLLPGDNSFTITMTGATTASMAKVSGETRYERPW
jgi:hypothetical protein